MVSSPVTPGTSLFQHIKQPTTLKDIKELVAHDTFVSSVYTTLYVRHPLFT